MEEVRATLRRLGFDVSQVLTYSQPGVYERGSRFEEALAQVGRLVRAHEGPPSRRLDHLVEFMELVSPVSDAAVMPVERAVTLPVFAQALEQVRCTIRQLGFPVSEVIEEVDREIKKGPRFLDVLAEAHRQRAGR